MSRYPGSLYDNGYEIHFILYYNPDWELYRELDGGHTFWMGPNMPTGYELVLQ